MNIKPLPGIKTIDIYFVTLFSSNLTMTMIMMMMMMMTTTTTMTTTTMMMIIHFNEHLLWCRLASTSAYYKASTKTEMQHKTVQMH
jgi:hypothetical protein